MNSSMICAVGYDSKKHTLEVVFNSGKIYQYYDVPKEAYKALMATNSKGQYMRANIIQ